MVKSEEEIFNKAVGKQCVVDGEGEKSYNCFSLPYVSMEQLIFKLKAVIPTASQLAIHDLNDRNKAGCPALTTKMLNPIRFNIIPSSWNSSATVLSQWVDLEVIIEGENAHVKILYKHVW